MNPLATLPLIALMAVSVVAYGRWLDKNPAGGRVTPLAARLGTAVVARQLPPAFGSGAFSRSPRCADTYRVFPQIQSAAGRLGKGAE